MEYQIIVIMTVGDNDRVRFYRSIIKCTVKCCTRRQRSHSLRLVSTPITDVVVVVVGFSNLRSSPHSVKACSQHTN